jgi:hypothetical protein
LTASVLAGSKVPPAVDNGAALQRRGELRQKIARLAGECHVAAGSKLEAETELDELVANVLGITTANVNIMRAELDLLGGIAPPEDDEE